MLDTLQEIWGAIKRNKMRTIATGFAVASGIFLMIILQGASNGIIHTLEKNSGGLAFDAIQVWGGQTSIPHEGLKEGRSIKLDERDIAMADESFSDNVVSTTAEVSQSGLIASVGENYMSVSLSGIYPEYADIEDLKIIQGRFINKIDMDEKRKVVVMSEDNAKNFFKDVILVVVLALDGYSNQVVAGPDIVTRGFVYVKESDEMLEEARTVVDEAVFQCQSKGISDWGKIKNTIKDSLGEYVWKKTKRRPMILPIILEV